MLGAVRKPTISVRLTARTPFAEVTHVPVLIAPWLYVRVNSTAAQGRSPHPDLETS